MEFFIIYYIYIFSVFLVSWLLLTWYMDSEGKLTLMDLAAVIMLSIFSPLGLLAWLIGRGNEIVIWKGKNYKDN